MDHPRKKNSGAGSRGRNGFALILMSLLLLGGLSAPSVASAVCGNDNPYSPKCLGKSCPYVNILEGQEGEFYISRFDNFGNAENPQTKHSTPKKAPNMWADRNRPNVEIFEYVYFR